MVSGPATLDSGSSEVLDVISGERAPSPAVSESSGTGSHWFPEETHLARALFRRGAEAVASCDWYQGFLKPPAEEGFIEPRLHDLSLGKDQLDVQREDQPDDQRADEERSASTQASIYVPLCGPTACRMLVLGPGQGNEMLHCSFRNVDLKWREIPAFEALSYSWGDSLDTVGILCQGQSVQITKSLYSVLKEIRCSDRQRLLWADALCINQKDPQELGQQVAIMRKIYKSADRVLVWLGDDPQGLAPDAFGLCCSIVERWRLSPDQPIKDGFGEYMNMMVTPEAEEMADYSSIGLREWEPLKRMFELSWFERLWVIQEVTVQDSIIVLWGDASIPWSLIGLASAWIMTKGFDLMRKHPIPSAFNAFLMYALPVCGKTAFKELNFSNILGSTRGRFLATDARDRIYSLLGIATNGFDPEMQLFMVPDYTRPLPAIYTEAAKKILHQDRHLRLLSAVQHGETIQLEYPSWVPCWHESKYESFGFRDETSNYANLGELFEPNDEGTFGDDPSATLNINGIFVDVVGPIVGPVMEQGKLDRSEWEDDISGAFVAVVNEMASAEKDYRTTWNFGSERFGLFRDDSAGETYTSNVTLHPGKYRQRDEQAVPRGYLGELLLYWRERSMWDDDIEVHRSGDAGLMDWYRRKTQSAEASERCLGTLYACYKRRIFVSEDGRPGLGPPAMQPGDWVCVLYGANVPFVLRRCWDDERQEEYHLLVGECFVPGIMGGECVERRRKSDCRCHDKRFVLR